MVDALATLHGQLTLPTHNCSTFLIDAVYILPGLMSGVTGGYLAFGDRLLSYHWGLWVDLNVDILFGSSNQCYMVGHTRQLKCNDPMIVTKYNHHMLAEMQQKGYPDNSSATQYSSATITGGTELFGPATYAGKITCRASMSKDQSWGWHGSRSLCRPSK